MDAWLDSKSPEYLKVRSESYVYGCNGTDLAYRGVPLGWGAGWAIAGKYE